MVQGKLDTHMQKNETGPPLLHHTQKSAQNGFRDMNIRPEIIKLWGKCLDSHDFFFLLNTVTTNNKSKNKQMGLHQTKNLLHS